MYQTDYQNQHHELGTSGFLYRSNKLMYDHRTKSMWSTLHGEPVLGPLVGKGIQLQRGYVVTTNWGQWKQQHPDTSVLSIKTGFRRDYGEGVAYRNYFATDELMFGVPELDRRLKNKAEVLALRNDSDSLAISTELLNRNTVYHGQLGQQRFVVLTDAAGSHRVYDGADVMFDSWNQTDEAFDTDGETWNVKETELTHGATRLKRIPAHRSFWFGWQAQFPDTQLVK